MFDVAEAAKSEQQKRSGSISPALLSVCGINVLGGGRGRLEFTSRENLFLLAAGQTTSK